MGTTISMISFTVRKSERVKNLRITILQSGQVVVTLPHTMSEKKALQFVHAKQEWIKKSVEKMKKIEPNEGRRILPKGTKKEFEECKKEASHFVKERLHFFNKAYGYTWGVVTIKNVSTRWGSCSKSGDLNFSYKIVFLPKTWADYIIVHELCHLGAFNHSQQFWELVAREIPDYKKIKKELRGVL